MYLVPKHVEYRLTGDIDYNYNRQLPEIVEKEIELIVLKYGLQLEKIDARVNMENKE